jgi:hypothetical protein
MAILALFTGQGYTKEMYETLRKEVDWEHKKAPGGMFHVASFDQSGNTIHVADVWESEDQLNEFVKSRLMPVMQKHKMPSPKTEVYQAYNIDAYPEINKYVV